MEDHTGGANNDPTLFTGVWYLYVASTFDGGQTWTTQNITPDDPIQRGPICGGGTCRNLLDFFDATIDKEGRVLLGYDVGCVSASCINGGNNDFTSKAAIARQTGGKRMLAAFDPSEPAKPGAPVLAASLNGAGTVATLTWPAPDNAGAAITGYNVYRKVGAAAFSLLATVPVTTYVDSSFTPGDVYHVTAGNAQVEGPYCSDVAPVAGAIPPDPCTLPGVLAVADTDGDAAPNTPPDPRVNVLSLYLAEPLFTPVAEKLVFTLNVAPSTAGAAPPSSQWYIVWNRQGTDPSDSGDAVFPLMKCPRHRQIRIQTRRSRMARPTAEHTMLRRDSFASRSRIPNFARLMAAPANTSRAQLLAP